MGSSSVILVALFLTLFCVSRVACVEHDGCILILGSDGVIGRAIATQLSRSGETVCEIHGRMDLDLRIQGSLKSRLAETRVRYVLFLAFEVGGSKYLSASGNAQIQLERYNQMIYKEVFSFLDQKNVPFMFISSQMALASKSTYGQMKLMGEQLTLSKPCGVVVRLWNVIGWESPGVKAHVFVDWINACLKAHEAIPLTNGLEQRQFMHAADAAIFLIKLMHLHCNEGLSSIPGPFGRERIIDVSSGVWHTMRAAGRHLEATFQSFKHPCKIEFRNDAPQSASSICIQPNLTMPHRMFASTFPSPPAPLEEGLKLILEEALIYQTKRLEQTKEIALIVMFDCNHHTQSSNDVTWKKFSDAQEMWGRNGEDYDLFLVPYGCKKPSLVKSDPDVHVLTIPQCREEYGLSPSCIIETSRLIHEEWSNPWLIFTSSNTYYPKYVYLEANPRKTVSFSRNAFFTLAGSVVKPCHWENVTAMEEDLVQMFHSMCQGEESLSPKYDMIECISTKYFQDFIVISADSLRRDMGRNTSSQKSWENNSVCFGAPIRKSPMFYLSQSCDP
eukprot:TRINITY_DN20573_c0_g1_i1.p1 TRINITY_DN20573_c0_g1~~TRINITY_DN20573_c0_g1_i1.p1  ORF type:complete len:559 (-),score=123.11 TRINITY_DN20573_c0_g1_i1:345-2021(-)